MVPPALNGTTKETGFAAGESLRIDAQGSDGGKHNENPFHDTAPISQPA